MRLSHSLIAAGALLVAAPAMAQDNAAAPANAVANNGVEANSTNAAAGPISPTTAAATPGTQNATLPQSAPPAAETQAPATIPAHRKFPWGVIGLLGLIGLFGVRKIKG